MIKHVAILLSLTLVGACAHAPVLTSNPRMTVVDSTVLPPPTDAEGASYRIGAADRLILDVVGFTELSNRRVQVDGSGRIDVPMAGSVAVGGLTPAQASDAVVRRLRAAFVRNPQVSLNVEEALSRYVTVDGQVGIPGNYPINGEMTLMRAVAAARGASEFARLDDVVVFRTVGGQHMAALYNMAAIRRGIYDDPRVYANDVIVVGNSSARRLFRDLLTTVPLLLSPIISVLVNPGTRTTSTTTTTTP